MMRNDNTNVTSLCADIKDMFAEITGESEDSEDSDDGSGEA